MRAGFLLLLLAAAACRGLPARTDDRTTPERSYETFRGALARDEWEREWDCLSDPLRRRLGLRDRGDWKDARVLVLTGRHALVRGVVASEVAGASSPRSDGRVSLDLEFPLGYRGSVLMSRLVVLRIFIRGESRPRIYEQLERLDLKVEPDALRVALDPELVRDWREFGVLRPEDEIDRIEAGVEWFLDDFRAGEESPDTVREAVEASERERTSGETERIEG